MTKMGLAAGLLGLIAAVAPAAADDDVDQIVERQSAPVSADTINPYALLDLTREQLEERFPSLSEAELDRLQFKIADISSMELLEEIPASDE